MANGVSVDEAFERHIAPTRDALSALLDTAGQLRDEWGYMPAADSQAMAELAAEGQLAGDSPWGNPVQDAYNQAHLLLFSMEDCARALVRDLSQKDAPVYAHVVLARAVLEYASRAWWLLQPTIAVRLRVARLANERIFGLAERRHQARTDEERAEASKRLDDLLAEATRLGFETVRNDRRGQRYVQEIRPGQTELIKELFASPGGDAALGALIYGAFSAVAHGTTVGLMKSVRSDAPNAPRTPGVTWGAVVASSDEVVSVLTAVILATATAYGRRNAILGWPSQSWNEALSRAIDATKQSFPPRTTT